MKMIHRRILLIAGVAAPSIIFPAAFLRAQEVPNAVKEAISVATKKGGAPNPDTMSEWVKAASQLKMVEQCYGGGDVKNCIREAMNYRDAAHDPDVLAMWSNVVTELTKKQKDIEVSVIDVVQKAQTNAAEACLKARTAGDLDDVLDALNELKSRKGLYAAGKVASRMSRIEGVHAFVTLWQQYLSSAETGNIADSNRIVEQMLASSGNFIVPRSSILKLRKTDGPSDTDIIKEIDAAIIRARDACLAARKPEDLDATQDDLGRLQTWKNNASAPRTQTRFQVLDAAAQFIQEWQRHLFSLQGGDTESARVVVQNLLSQMGNGRLLLPRGILYDRMLELDRTANVTGMKEFLKTITLTNLFSAAAEAQSRADRSPEPMRSYLLRTVQTLQNFNSLRAAVESGRGEEALTLCATMPTEITPWAEELNKLRAVLESRTIAMASGLDVGKLAKSGERPTEVLVHAADQAAGDKKWDEVHRVLTLLLYFKPKDMPAVLGEVQGCHLFLTGRRLEEAAQWREAAESYRRVLIQQGRRIPYQEAAERLRTITSDHPNETKAVSQQTSMSILDTVVVDPSAIIAAVVSNALPAASAFGNFPDFTTRRYLGRSPYDSYSRFGAQPYPYMY